MTLQHGQLSKQVAAVVESARQLAVAVPGVVAVGLAGSWARGSGRTDSDVDLIVLSADAPRLLRSREWFTIFDPEAELVRCEDFGAVQERRLRLSDGLVVEVGVGAPSWADIEPVDAGSRRVVSDGLLPVHDPEDLLANLIAAVAGGGAGASPRTD